MFQKVSRGGAAAAGALTTDTIEFSDGAAQLMLDPSHRVDGRKPAEQLRGFTLRGQPIILENGKDLFGNGAYTVTIEFCKTRPNDRGVLVNFDGSFRLAVEQASVEASLGTTLGERRLKADGFNFAVGEWHRIALTFSGQAGRSDLYLDARRVASSTNLAGASQAGNFFAELTIGCAAEPSFTGRLDDFRFLDAALDRDALAAL